MSFIKETFFGIKCDNCKASFETELYSFWQDKAVTTEEAQESGWTEEGKLHYCPNCHQFNEDDEIVLNIARTIF